MGLRMLELFLVASLGWLLLEQSYVTCDYGGKNQYPAMNNDAYGQGGGDSGYGDSNGEDGYGYGGGEDRPKIKLNFGVHVPAMRIQLPRLSLPKITIRAKVKQPNKPSTIHVPEINLETQSKVSPPGSKSASGDDGYGDSYGGSYNNGGNGASNYGGQMMGGYNDYSHPAPMHYQSTKKQQAPSYGRGNNYEKNQDSTYISASNDYRDGTTSVSLSKDADNGAYASSNKDYSVISDYNKSKNDNYAQDATNQMRQQFTNINVANNNDQIIDNYNSASTNRDAIESRDNIIATKDNMNVGDNKYRVASNSIMLNFPERFRSNQQTYLLDKSRSSSMIEPQPNNDMVSKPVHLVYSAIQQPIIDDEERRINQNYQSQHLNNMRHINNNNDNVNNNANMPHSQQGHLSINHSGQESRTFLQKISSPFHHVRNWLRPHNKE